MNRRHFLALLSALPWVGSKAAAYAGRSAGLASGKGPYAVRHKPAEPPRVPPAPWQAKPDITLFALGDWGTAGALQKRVASGMNTVAADSALHPVAIISTGDNIYPNGVASVNDKQWTSKFEQIYTGSNIQVPWWAVLGNHDHRQSADAQVEYTKKNPKWNMPGRLWTQDFTRHGAIIRGDGGDSAATANGRVEALRREEVVMTVFGIDTQVLLQKTKGWEDQVRWLDEKLGACTSTWKVVVGHHPLRSYGYYGDQSYLVNNIKPLLDAHGVSVYLCGHDHDLQLIKHPTDEFFTVVSGAGGGGRDTSYGEHSHFADTNGGFAALLCSKKRLDVRFYDAYGTETYKETLKTIA